MKYKSVDELEQFRFQDAEIVSLQVTEEKIEFTLEAVIIRGNNSNNLNYTDQYADTLSMRLMQCKVLGAFKEGSSYYDANDTLIEKTPDETVLEKDWNALLKKLKEGHIFVFDTPQNLREKLGSQFPEQFVNLATKQKQQYILAVDVAEDEELIETTYWMALSFDKSILEWNRFMNKPEGM